MITEPWRLKGDYHLRPITENGFKRIVKMASFLLIQTQTFRMIGKKTQKNFRKRSINVFILSSKMRNRRSYFGRQWIWRLSCAHAPYYGLSCTNVVSTIMIKCCILNGLENILNLTVFVICTCAILSHNGVALVNSYSSEAPKFWLILLKCLCSNFRQMWDNHFLCEYRKYEMSRIILLFKIVYIIRLACRHIIKYIYFGNKLTLAL